MRGLHNGEVLWHSQPRHRTRRDGAKEGGTHGTHVLILDGITKGAISVIRSV